MSEQPQRSWWGRNWKWVVPVGCVTPILLCGGCVTLVLTLVFGVMKSSAAYKDSLAAVQTNVQAQRVLGVPIEPGLIVTGRVETSGGSGSADIAYTVSGPNGSGTVHASAGKAAGQWTFSSLVLEIKNTGERIDLLSPQ